MSPSISPIARVCAPVSVKGRLSLSRAVAVAPQSLPCRTPVAGPYQHQRERLANSSS
jgi:hypothetical protein